MSALALLGTNQAAQWLEILERSHLYDFYHLPSYHSLAEQQQEGIAKLFVYEKDDDFIAIPLLIRPIDAVEGLAEVGIDWQDATSVYGYPGPITSRPDISRVIMKGFQEALIETMKDRRIVAAFSRLNPILSQNDLISNIGELVFGGSTVTIDLNIPPEIQRSKYRKNHKQDINRMKRLGTNCFLDYELRYLDEFIKIYHETMRRVDARSNYYFNQSYFQALMSNPASSCHLFVCLLDEQVICGGIFSLCNNIVQYHLGGTRDDFLHLAPMKLVFDTVRVWANEQKAEVFHLGGGVGGKNDSLFLFKTGFSDKLLGYWMWKLVVFPEMYERLAREKDVWNRQRLFKPTTSDFFPQYRCPSTPIDEATVDK